MAKKVKTTTEGKVNEAIKVTNVELDFTQGYEPVNTDSVTKKEIANLKEAVRSENKKMSIWSKLKGIFTRK